MKKYFTKYPPFINRIKEKQYILDYFNSSPTNIMFIYGPKSTGKSTLIRKIVTENLDQKEYAVSFLDIRGNLINEFRDFKEVFFPLDFKGKIKDIVSGIRFNTGFFGWSVEDDNMLKTNVFALMIKKLVKANENGIKPVIIIDEFQYLKDIYIDDQKEIKLLNELIKLLIKITKVENLAHVVCLTSDSYYLEELYSDTKLTNTSNFYLIKHLNKDDIYGWLESENCPEKMIKDVWKNLGGSVWEIWQVLVGYKNTGDYKETLDDLIQTKYGLVAELVDPEEENLTKDQKKEFNRVAKGIIKDGYYSKLSGGVTNELIKKLVSNDIWFYDSKTRTISANSKSFEIVFKRVLKELKK